MAMKVVFCGGNRLISGDSVVILTNGVSLISKKL